MDMLQLLTDMYPRYQYLGRKYSGRDRRPAGGGVEEVRRRQLLIPSRTDSDLVVDARTGGSLAVVLREFRLQEEGGSGEGMYTDGWITRGSEIM